MNFAALIFVGFAANMNHHFREFYGLLDLVAPLQLDLKRTKKEAAALVTQLEESSANVEKLCGQFRDAKKKVDAMIQTVVFTDKLDGWQHNVVVTDMEETLEQAAKTRIRPERQNSSIPSHGKWDTGVISRWKEEKLLTIDFSISNEYPPTIVYFFHVFYRVPRAQGGDQ